MPEPARWALQPIDLTTSQLQIRAFTQADIVPDYLAWLNDKFHMRYSNQRFIRHSRETVRTYLEGFDGKSATFLALILRDSQQLTGTATVFASVHHGAADIGILIGSEFTGRRLAQEAVAAIAAKLLAGGFRKVSIGTSAANAAMLRVIQKVGFLEDGVKVRQELIDGVETDVVYFAMFSEDKL